MTSLFSFIWYVFQSLVSFLGTTFVIGDLGFTVGTVIIVFFVLGIVITYLIPGVSSASSTVRYHK